MKDKDRQKEKPKQRQVRRKSSDDSDSGEVRVVSSEALRGVAAIFCFAIAGFLILAAFGVGGTLGAALYSLLTWLLGVGYLLLPISLAMLGILIFRSMERRFEWVQLVSMAIFLLSGLGLISVFVHGKGGLLGDAVATPMTAAVDSVATVIFLISFIIAAIVVAFDVNLGNVVRSLRTLFSPTENTDTGSDISTASVTGLTADGSDDFHEEADDTVVDDTTESTPPSPETRSTPEKEPEIKKFSDAVSTGGEGYPVFAATGSAYSSPSPILLAKNKGKPEVGDVKSSMNIIKRTLQNFGIQVEMDEASIGPTVTRYSMKPAEGVKLSKIVALQSNLELALAASPVRIEAPIPGKSLVGIEVPNIARTTLGMGPLVSDEEFVNSTKPLLIAMGRSITGQAQFSDLARMPHLLVAGTTGSGKSATIHQFVISLLYRCGPEKLRFIMVDPKRVELTMYNPVPHLITPVITDPKKAIEALRWLVKEMERRYNILETERVQNIASYHENVLAPALAKGPQEGKSVPEAMPYIVVIIDELADIMTSYPRELEGAIVRLAQMSRAVGIHLILSTQRPSVKVITGLIKANIPSRVALQVASQIDSRTILDTGGAESLLGAGDMLFLSAEMSKPRRIQAAYISEAELKRVVDYIAKSNDPVLMSDLSVSGRGGPGAVVDPIFSSSAESSPEDDIEDNLYPEAKRTVIEARKASTSFLQRKLGIGYARAAKLIDILEEQGVIGPGDGAKQRDVLIGTDAPTSVPDDADYGEFPEDK